VMHNKAELKMPREEQIYRDRFRKGDMIRAVIKEVGRESNGDPRIVISRADELFMERLFELEVPEIDEGLVEIKKIVREPGDRAKVAVVSYDERIDPVGACVGMKGSRIHSVVRELGNENIDVVQWTEDPVEMIKRALSPAKPVLVQLNDQLTPPRAKVVVQADEVSQAIGRGGINIRLASRLTGYEIDVYREISEEEEDIEIQEFSDEIPEELLKKLRDIGCDTARAVLELSRDELMRRTAMTEAEAGHVLGVIRAEFSEDEAAAEETATAPVASDSAAETATEPEATAAAEETTESAEEEATEKVDAEKEAEDSIEGATTEDAPAEETVEEDAAAEEKVEAEANDTKEEEASDDDASAESDDATTATSEKSTVETAEVAEEVSESDKKETEAEESADKVE